MKIRFKILGVLAAGYVTGIAMPPRAAAEVSDEDFNALKEAVRQLSDKVQKLEQTHEEDQKTHEQDQQKIQQLQQQVGETQKAATKAQQNVETASQMKLKLGQLEEQVEAQKTATEAQGKAVAAAQVQPVAPVPGGALATHNFTLSGDAEVQFGKTTGQHSAFTLADFAPVFLFRAGDNVLFEAGFDIRLQNGAVTLASGQTGNSGTTTTIDLSFATIDYLLNDYVTVVAGDMLLPLGTYSERSAGWLNKIPDDPLPRGVLPGSGIGVQLRGSIPIGQNGQQVTYAAYAANGPGSVDGSGKATFVDSSGNVLPNLDFGNVGIQSNGNTGNEHSAVSGGGRLGWFFPLKPNYDLELGISGQTGPWNNSGGQNWSALVADAALHISPYFELKGEYINTWWQTADMGTLAPRGWWVQGAYKLAGLNQNLNIPLVNNLELVSRLDWSDDGLGTRTQRETVGYVYYLTNTLLLEGDYEWLHTRGPNAGSSNKWVFQLSYGF
jgi:TolA-binding protein